VQGYFINQVQHFMFSVWRFIQLWGVLDPSIDISSSTKPSKVPAFCLSYKLGLFYYGNKHALGHFINQVQHFIKLVWRCIQLWVGLDPGIDISSSTILTKVLGTCYLTMEIITCSSLLCKVILSTGHLINQVQHFMWLLWRFIQPWGGLDQGIGIVSSTRLSKVLG